MVDLDTLPGSLVGSRSNVGIQVRRGKDHVFLLFRRRSVHRLPNAPPLRGRDSALHSGVGVVDGLGVFMANQFDGILSST